LSALVVNDGSGDLALTKNGARSTAGFDAEHTTYSVPNVAVDIAEIIITATAPATAASISINGIAAASGEAATRMLEFGDNLLRIAVTAADGATSRTYRISLHRTRPPLAFAETQAALRFHTDGAAVSAELPAAADSGMPPYTYTLGGALPSGLAFDADTRIISGTPAVVSAESSASLTYTLSDAATPAASVAQTFTLGLAPAVAFATPAPSALTFDFNAAVSETLPELSGGFGYYDYALEGELPAGLAFAPATRILSGMPSALGRAALTYRASDLDGVASGVLRADVNLVVIIAPPAAPANLAVSPADARLRVSWDAHDITAGGGELPSGYHARWRLKDADGAGTGTAPGAWQSAAGDDDAGESIGTAPRYVIRL